MLINIHQLENHSIKIIAINSGLCGQSPHTDTLIWYNATNTLSLQKVAITFWNLFCLCVACKLQHQCQDSLPTWGSRQLRYTLHICLKLDVLWTYINVLHEVSAVAGIDMVVTWCCLYVHRVCVPRANTDSTQLVAAIATYRPYARTFMAAISHAFLGSLNYGAYRLMQGSICVCLMSLLLPRFWVRGAIAARKWPEGWLGSRFLRHSLSQATLSRLIDRCHISGVGWAD